jgi:catechol 2,3-dioxygenase-like lactoylglutathione lyase family enzyme
LSADEYVRRVDLQRAVPILTVADVEGAIEEYTAVLGLPVVMNHGWIATFGSAGGPQFSVMTRDATAPCNPDVSLQVADVDGAFARVQASGHEIVHPLQDEEWGVRRFFFRAADGHVVNVLGHLD